MDPLGLQTAKALVNLGIEVIPAFYSRKDNSKVPLGGSWTQTKTKSIEQLEKWWITHPWAWVGVVSGPNSCLVIDADGNDGVDWLRNFINNWDCQDCLVYRTPRPGLHIICKWPSILGEKFKTAKIIHNLGEVQFRGSNHFTLFYGAPGRTGYEMLIEPKNNELGKIPNNLVGKFLDVADTSTLSGSENKGELSEISAEDAWKLAPFVDGRKNTLAGLSWYLAIRGYNLDDIIYITTRFGEECCVPSLTEETCRKKSEYAFNRAVVYKETQIKQATQSLSYLLNTN